jgi:hypothetical protein
MRSAVDRSIDYNTGQKKKKRNNKAVALTEISSLEQIKTVSVKGIR